MGRVVGEPRMAYWGRHKQGKQKRDLRGDIEISERAGGEDDRGAFFGQAEPEQGKRRKSVGGQGYLAQGENFQVKFSVNFIFLRYDIIMLTSSVDSGMWFVGRFGCHGLLFCFPEFVHMRICSVWLYSGFLDSFHKYLTYEFILEPYYIKIMLCSLMSLLSVYCFAPLLVVGMRPSMAELPKLGKWLCERSTFHPPS